MKVVAFIPARAGSKRLADKNLRLLGGRPLIEYTCRAALDSGVPDAVYINTDSRAIEAAAAECGVPSLGLRPAELATDDAPTKAAVLYFLRRLAERGEHYEAVMILQPTSPLRTADDIRAGWELFEQHAPCAVVGVAALSPQGWLGTVSMAGDFDRWNGDELVHRVNGALYIHRTDDYVTDGPVVRTVAYVMPTGRSIDIDTADDLAQAEWWLARSTAPSDAVSLT